MSLDYSFGLQLWYHDRNFLHIYLLNVVVRIILLAYQVMLTIRGRLITPFVLGSMSVSLNILIRHSFMDI